MKADQAGEDFKGIKNALTPLGENGRMKRREKNEYCLIVADFVCVCTVYVGPSCLEVSF